jgi:hypothetical protein
LDFDSEGNFMGLGDKGKKIMRDIADHLYMLHQAGFFCGELKDRVFIDPPQMYVTFPYCPEQPNDEALLRRAIQNDSIQYRCLLGMLLQNEPRLRRVENINRLKNFPTDIKYFLSNIFLLGLSQDDLETVKDHSFFLLYHPATFNAVDRIRFIHLMIEFRNRNRFHFESHLQLNKDDYMLSDWPSKLSPGTCLHTTMNRTVPASLVSNVGAFFPGFVRNVHHHFVQNCSADEMVFSFIYICQFG